MAALPYSGFATGDGEPSVATITPGTSIVQDAIAVVNVTVGLALPPPVPSLLPGAVASLSPTATIKKV